MLALIEIFFWRAIIYTTAFTIAQWQFIKVENDYKLHLFGEIWCLGLGAEIRCNDLGMCCQITKIFTLILGSSNILCAFTRGALLQAFIWVQVLGSILQTGLWLFILVHIHAWSWQAGLAKSGDPEFFFLMGRILFFIFLFFKTAVLTVDEFKKRRGKEY